MKLFYGCVCSSEAGPNFRQLNFQKLLYQVIKVADFGVARMQAPSGVMTAETGTYRWMAPEVVQLEKDNFVFPSLPQF